MKSKNHKYPLLIFKKQDKNIYATKKDFGIVSKGGEKFYKDITIIDSTGDAYELEKATIKGKAKWYVSLRYFQPMWELDFVLRKESTYNLSDVKKQIIDHIRKNPKHWLTLDGVERIEEKMEEARTFEDLIMIFR